MYTILKSSPLSAVKNLLQGQVGSCEKGEEQKHEC